VFQGTENLESFYPNITKPYEDVNLCHKKRKKPRRRKKPGDGENDNEDDEELEKNTKVYDSITDQQSSKLNNCERTAFSWLVLIILSGLCVWS
jgi:hypothetical protein